MAFEVLMEMAGDAEEEVLYKSFGYNDPIVKEFTDQYGEI